MDYPTDEEIIERVKSYGPFISIFCYVQWIKWISFRSLDKVKFACIRSTEKTLPDVMTSDTEWDPSILDCEIPLDGNEEIFDDS